MGLTLTPRLGATPQLDTPGFFGGDSGISYEELQARKRIARELMGGTGQIRTIGEGINSAAGSIAGALMKRRADKEESKQRDSFNEAFNSVVPGMFGGGMTARGSTKTPDASAPASGGAYDTSGMSTAATEAFRALEASWGNPLAVTSAYRSPEHNARVGGAKGSQHLHGNAYDVSTAGMSDAERQSLAKSAWDAGFRGIGVYDNSMHFDVGNPRAWGPSYHSDTAPDWAKAMVSGGAALSDPRMSSQGIRTAQAGGIDPTIIQQLAQLAGSPYANDGQRAIVQALLGQQLQAMQPPDPMEDLKRRQLELQIQQMEQGTGSPRPMTPEERAAWGIPEDAGPFGMNGQGMPVPLLGKPLVSVGDTLSPGQESADKEYGKAYVEWTQGGKADALNNIAKIEGVIGQMEGGDTNLTGPGIGLMPKGVRDIVAPESSFAQEQVEEVIQRNLRVILGAQFTEREGQRLIERAYNPRLDEKQNAQRLRQLLTAMKAAAEAKESQARYFEEHGTIRGWTGKEWTISDFERAMDGGSDAAKFGPVATHRFNPETGKVEAIQ